MEGTRKKVVKRWSPFVLSTFAITYLEQLLLRRTAQPSSTYLLQCLYTIRTLPMSFIMVSTFLLKSPPTPKARLPSREKGNTSKSISQGVTSIFHDF
ncbi:hypothetical protein Lalb_Chr11g0062411 [Lupinus albus]|uniref:Uncharacterized protein n=1 Tax=Lupinus albus TaxID=3870 RepID=A0A6A4PPP5_LUPAL|nr:hypothetical protein Lalb_Chr11g0062411 [Lupinus albus]